MCAQCVLHAADWPSVLFSLCLVGRRACSTLAPRHAVTSQTACAAGRASMRRLQQRTLEVIVTADDLGICAVRNSGIAEAARAGAVTAASVLANGPAARSAVTTFAGDGNAAMLGLHLNFTQGRALSSAESIPTLLRDGGRHGAQFLGPTEFRRAWARGGIDPAHLVQETVAQLGWFRDEVGRPPTHVDGHQHTHVLPGCAELLGPVLQAAGVQHVRIPYEPLPPNAAPACPTCSAALAHAASARVPYASAGVVAAQHFIGLSFCGVPYGPADLIEAVRRVQRADMELRALADNLEPTDDAAPGAAATSLSPRVVEIMTHPGGLLPVPSAEAAGDGNDEWGDERGFFSAPERWQELQTLCSPMWRDVLQDGLIWDGKTATVARGGGSDSATSLRLVGYEASVGMACLRRQSLQNELEPRAPLSFEDRMHRSGSSSANKLQERHVATCK